jgi:hypothetical protein
MNIPRDITFSPMNVVNLGNKSIRSMTRAITIP